jgi:hypothetical protein
VRAPDIATLNGRVDRDRWRVLNICMKHFSKLPNQLTNSLTHSIKQSLLENLIVVQVVKKLPPSMEPEGSLPCSQEPATGPYLKPDDSSPQRHTLFILTPVLISSFHLRFRLVLSPCIFSK